MFIIYVFISSQFISLQLFLGTFLLPYAVKGGGSSFIHEMNKLTNE